MELLNGRLSQSARNIILGLQDAQNIDLNAIPEDSIIYNFEQFTKGSKAFLPHYMLAMQRFEVWDYSQRNVELLNQSSRFSRVKHVPLGYMPQMKKINPDYPKDIDVLLYGVPNARRKAVIDNLKQRGVNALLACDVFASQRDGLIARSRLALNVHFYLPGILEIVRLSYLWANAVPVVSELNSDTEIPENYKLACSYAPYEKLADKVAEVLNDEHFRIKQGLKGHHIFAAENYAAILENALNYKS